MPKNTGKKLYLWNRAFHRDLGYLSIGLTFVFAVSGIFVNHFTSWQTSFKVEERTYHIGKVDRGELEVVAQEVLTRLEIDEKPKQLLEISQDRIRLVLHQRNLDVELDTGDVKVEILKPRRVIPLLNFLHLNEAGRLWTYVSDLYAITLMLLATTGLFMIRGDKGLTGRGLRLCLAGFTIPIFFWVLYY